MSVQWAPSSPGDLRSVNYKETDWKDIVHLLLLLHNFPTSPMLSYKFVKRLIFKSKYAYQKYVKCKCTVNNASQNEHHVTISLVKRMKSPAARCSSPVHFFLRISTMTTITVVQSFPGLDYYHQNNSMWTPKCFIVLIHIFWDSSMFWVKQVFIYFSFSIWCSTLVVCHKVSTPMWVDIWMS